MMKSRSFKILLAIILTAVAAAAAPAQSRTQGQSIPSEKKKSLSNIGPEDVFPGEQPAQRPQRRQQTARGSRRATEPERAAPEPTPTPAAAPVAVGVPAQSPTPGRPKVEAESQSLARAQAQPPAPQAPGWLLPFLITLSLIVLSAFLYVLYKLLEKLRQG